MEESHKESGTKNHSPPYTINVTESQIDTISIISNTSIPIHMDTNRYHIDQLSDLLEVIVVGDTHQNCMLQYPRNNNREINAILTDC